MIRIWPWSALRSRDRMIKSLRRYNDELSERIRLGTAENKRLAAERIDLYRKIGKLNDQLSSVRPLDPGAAGAMQAEKDNSPDFVMLGLTRPAGMGVRLYASRDLPQAQFGPPPMPQNVTAGAYLLHSVMANMLVIDKPTYAEAMARMNEIWANWDREKKTMLEDAGRRRPSPDVIRELTAFNEPPELEMPK